MDREGPTSSVGRTFWVVWYYITGSINRFFRLDAANNLTNDPDSLQESAVDSGSVECGHTEEEASEKDVEEAQPLTALSVRSSPHPVVAWEICSSESRREPGVVDVHKTQLTDSQDKASIQSGDIREGVLALTEDAGQINAEDDQQKHKGDMQEDGGGLGKRLSESKEDTGAEEALTECDQQGMDKDSIKVQTRIGPIDGDDTMSQGDKVDLEKEDGDINLRLSQEEEDTEENMVHVVSLASENEGESNVSVKQVTNQLSVTKQSADKNGNVPEGEVVHATNLADMQSHDVKRESSGMISDGDCDMLTPAHRPVNDRLIHESQAEKEKLACGIEEEECHKEASHTSACLTVSSVNNDGQESGDFKNILPGICEGQGVESQGINPSPFGEVQRGFPEGNNEQGQDENRMEKFLEETIDPVECQTVLLPEEMESKQSIQNNGSSTGSKDLLLTEHTEEEEKTKEDIQESSDLVAEDHHGNLHLTDAALPQGEEARGLGLTEDFGECGLVRQEIETESTFLEDNTTEMQDAVLNMEKLVHKDKDEVALKDESKSENEKILIVGVASMSESNTESSKSSAVESEPPVTQKQQLKATINDTVSKSTAKDMTVVSGEEPEKHMPIIYMEDTSLHSAEEVTDEQTVDPRMQTLLSQETDSIKQQEESEPRQQMDLNIEPANDEEDESSSDLTGSEEQCVERSQSGRSEFRSEGAMSSCTDESTFLEDTPCRSGAHEVGSQLWTQVTGSIDGISANISESDVSECFIPEPSIASLDIVMEETTEAQQSGHLNEESVESEGNVNQESGSQSHVGVTDHPVETENKIHKEDIQSSTEMDTFVQVAKVNEGTPTDSEGEVEDAGLGACRSPSEVSLEGENVSTECGSEGDAELARLLKLSFMGTPEDGWPEDDARQTQVTAHLTEGSTDPMQVQTSVLDSSPQKARIAIKNPRVRPPTDPRLLLHMPSLNPTAPSHLPAKAPVGFPVAGLGIGIKLPGLGRGLPVLKKTQPKGNEMIALPQNPQEVEPKPESSTDVTEEEEEAQCKPKWMPPQQAGFGNPFMSELLTKLKKTTQDNEL